MTGKRRAILLLLPLLVRMLVAEEPQTENASEIESFPEVFLQVTSSPAAKLGFIWHFTIPFLQGNNPLTQGNNIVLSPGVEITPVDFHLTAEAVWTPIAFAELIAGSKIGSGWNMNLFGSNVHGIGLNRVGHDYSSAHDGRALDGVLWQAHIGAALQGDLAAFFPGEWNHLIFRTLHEISYAGYSRAGTGDFWFFQNDSGENRNGFSYRGNLLIGYRMPLFLDMVALQAEAELFLQGPPGRERWGDDRLRWTFSGALNFVVTERFEVTLITQFRTMRNFVEDDWRDRHFTKRTLDTSGRPQRLEFYRIVASMTYRF